MFLLFISKYWFMICLGCLRKMKLMEMTWFGIEIHKSQWPLVNLVLENVELFYVERAEGLLEKAFLPRR